ncbi:MAG: photosystem I reaction center protein subunit XI, partial [Leptolyngbya sp. SIO1D8]|nr:photosystem I reaction center protein subunit XI [Leptolyngbya sp. SIO1D8]
MADIIRHAGDPQIGNLATPLNASALTQSFIGNLPAYRAGLVPQRRGLEVGMAHGYFLYGPFAMLGPLRDSDIPGVAGLLSAVGLVMILTVGLSLYSGVGIDAKVVKATTPFPPPEDFSTTAGWKEFATGFATISGSEIDAFAAPSDQTYRFT